jgi:hypothetical protein
MVSSDAYSSTSARQLHIVSVTDPASLFVRNVNTRIHPRSATDVSLTQDVGFLPKMLVKRTGHNRLLKLRMATHPVATAPSEYLISPR